MGESVNDILGGRAQPPWLHALPRASVYEPENRKECVGRRKRLEKRQIRQDPDGAVRRGLALTNRPQKFAVMILAPQVRLELTTLRLTAGCSTD